LLIGDDLAGREPQTLIDDMEHNVVVDEKEIALDRLIEVLAESAGQGSFRRWPLE
jgi:hypothetical protein